jgi:hypothetical protein
MTNGQCSDRSPRPENRNRAKEHAGFKTTIRGAGERETPARSVNNPKAGRRRRAPRSAHQQSHHQDLRSGPPGLPGWPRQCVGTRRAFHEDKRGPTMTNDQLTAILAERVLGWRAAPDRFIKPGRSWTPRSRFKPFTRLEDVFLLLERAGCTWVLSVGADRVFTARVRVGGRVGKASGEPKARTITRALCQALAIEVM